MPEPIVLMFEFELIIPETLNPEYRIVVCHGYPRQRSFSIGCVHEYRLATLNSEARCKDDA